MQLTNRQMAVIAVLALPLLACGKADRRFESVCQIVRRDVVEQDKAGVPAVIDLEFEWDPCPGDQFQVVRGDKAFAACTERYKLGSLVPVLVRQWWDDRGYYTWDVYQVGECTREIQPYSEGSYEKSQDCRPLVMYGEHAGFSCSRRPFKKLLAICPWMARD